MTDLGSSDLHTAESMLLAACAGATLGSVPPEGPWLRFAELAASLRVASTLWAQANGAGWPEIAAAICNKQYRRNAIRSLRLRGTLVALDRACAHLGVEYCALKGAALMVEIYRDPAARMMRDLDLLLDRRGAQVLHDWLQVNGWSVPPGILRQPDRDAIHLPVLIEEASGVGLELHFQVGSKDWLQGSELAGQLLSEAQIRPCLNGQVRISAPGPLLAHVLVHAFSGQIFDTGPQLLCDVRAILESGHLAPDDCAEIIARYDLSAFANLVDAVAERFAVGRLRLGGAQIWKPDEDSVTDAAALMLAPPGRAEARRMALTAANKTSLLSRAAWLLRSAFEPAPEALAKLSGRPANDPVRWLAYPRWLGTRALIVLNALGDRRLAHERALDARLRRLVFGRANPDKLVV